MSAPASQTQWYLARDGQQYGPLSEPELAKFIELGHLQPTDLLWREGFPDWRPAMVDFPQRGKPAMARPPQPAPPPGNVAPQPTTGTRAARAQAPAGQGRNPKAGVKVSLGPMHVQTAAGYAAADEPEPRGGAVKWMLLGLVGLVVLGAVGWYGYQRRADLLGLVPEQPSQVAPGSIAAGDRKGLDTSPLAGFSGPPGAIDATLQATPLWRIVKREFPDWYAERLKEIAGLAAQNKGEAEIGQQVARALVALRRQNVSHALAAGFPQLKAVASTFYENLVQLRKQSADACFEFISQGEASPTVVSLLQGSPHTAHLQAQLTAVFEAVADGRKAVRSYPQPRKTDYDVLQAELAKLGWTPADMQLFSDEKALARASHDKVCQLVQDWFAAQLAIKDHDMQLRLLVDSLKPVVAG